MENDFVNNTETLSIQQKSAYSRNLDICFLKSCMKKCVTEFTPNGLNAKERQCFEDCFTQKAEDLLISYLN